MHSCLSVCLYMGSHVPEHSKVLKPTICSVFKPSGMKGSSNFESPSEILLDKSSGISAPWVGHMRSVRSVLHFGNATKPGPNVQSLGYNYIGLFWFESGSVSRSVFTSSSQCRIHFVLIFVFMYACMCMCIFVHHHCTPYAGSYM